MSALIPSPSSPDDRRFLVAGCRSWNRQTYDRQIRTLPGTWRFVARREELSVELVREFRPRFVFFLHWSWIVPAEIVSACECVCFHMTDVPFGRGGSPLQNLIVRGHRETKLTALRMTAEVDAGPVYLKCPLSLEGGSAEEIFIRASSLSAEMIATLIAVDSPPQPQSGEVTVFRRRRPEESAIPALRGLDQLHDFVRMLDADGYPRAFIDHEGFRYTFSRAARHDGRVVADVTITALPPLGSGGVPPEKV